MCVRLWFLLGSKPYTEPRLQWKKHIDRNANAYHSKRSLWTARLSKKTHSKTAAGLTIDSSLLSQVKHAIALPLLSCCCRSSHCVRMWYERLVRDRIRAWIALCVACANDWKNVRKKQSKEKQSKHMNNNSNNNNSDCSRRSSSNRSLGLASCSAGDYKADIWASSTKEFHSDHYCSPLWSHTQPLGVEILIVYQHKTKKPVWKSLCNKVFSFRQKIFEHSEFRRFFASNRINKNKEYIL